MTLPKPYYSDKWVTIYHGDCRKILPELPKVDLVLTDPPYGINYQSNYRGEKFEAIEGDSSFPTSWLTTKAVNPNGSTYVFCNEKSMEYAQRMMRASGFNTLRILVWDKGATSAGDLNNYGARCEFILYSKRKYAKLRGARDSNVISIPRVHPTVLRHPTEKPIELIDYLVMKSTDYGDLILDPFLGSGTTAYCAKKLNRKCIGIEIEEKYCEIAARRCSQGVFNLAEVGYG